MNKLCNHSRKCNGCVSESVATTENYIISSSFDEPSKSVACNIRRGKNPYRYIGTLIEDIDFGPIRKLFASEVDGKLMIVVASDKKVTLWVEQREGTRARSTTEVNHSFF